MEYSSISFENHQSADTLRPSLLPLAVNYINGPRRRGDRSPPLDIPPAFKLFLFVKAPAMASFPPRIHRINEILILHSCEPAAFRR
jgi:hypothetical protein